MGGDAATWLGPFGLAGSLGKAGGAVAKGVKVAKTTSKIAKIGSGLENAGKIVRESVKTAADKMSSSKPIRLAKDKVQQYKVKDVAKKAAETAKQSGKGASKAEKPAGQAGKKVEKPTERAGPSGGQAGKDTKSAAEKSDEAIIEQMKKLKPHDGKLPSSTPKQKEAVPLSASRLRMRRRIAEASPAA
ncbi:hypothetical protein CDD83_11075 [Cordyceps sp. RAO-2017]|nr:hypothetical protein CDD83_11075 [Cordyceps sp. RAO-2017]